MSQGASRIRPEGMLHSEESVAAVPPPARSEPFVGTDRTLFARERHCLASLAVQPTPLRPTGFAPGMPSADNIVGARALPCPYLHDKRGSLAGDMQVRPGSRGAGGCAPRPKSGERSAAQPVTVGQAAGRSGRDPHHVALSSRAAPSPPRYSSSRSRPSHGSWSSAFWMCSRLMRRERSRAASSKARCPR